MSKILKNTTVSPINVVDTGVTIAASPGSYTIPPQDYLIWAASSDVITFIGSGDLVVNDGSFDLNINEGTDLILGLFPSSIQVSSFLDQETTGTITANGQSVTLTVDSVGSVGFVISNTWVGQIEFLGSIDGVTFESINAYPISGSDTAFATTTNGSWTVIAGSLKAVRVTSIAWTSGTADIAFVGTIPQNVVGVASFSPNSLQAIVNQGTNPWIVDASGAPVSVTQGTTPWIIDGTVAATQSGTWNIGTLSTITNPVTVAQATAANLNATVVGTGTFAVQAAQSGTWNITNISGTISLPTGAATEATLAKIPLAQGSTTSGQFGELVQGAVTTASPSYTNAQTSPLSLTTAGALRVDASGSTIPISGTVTANQGTSPWVVSGSVTANAGTNLNTSALALDTSVNGLLVSQTSTTSGQFGPLVQGAVTTASPTYTTGQTSPLSLTTTGALRINGPVTQSGTWNIGTVTTVTTVSTLTTITNAVTVAQATAANLNATVVGTGTFAVQAAQSGTWNITNISGTISLPTGAATEASLAKLTLTQGSTTSGQSGTLVQGAVTTSAPSYTTAQTSPLSLTTSGALRVDGSGSTQPISGTVTANAGTNLNTSLLALESTQIKLLIGAGSTTSSQSGPAIMGAVTTAAPSYTTGQVNWLSLTTAGALRIDGSGSTQPVSGTVAATQSGTWNIGTVTTVTAVTAITNSLPAGTNVIGALSANQSVNLAQVAGTTTSTGNGTANAGCQRVTIASDNTAFSVNATLTPSSSSTVAPSRAATTALATNLVVKASAGNLYTLVVTNTNSSSQFIQIHNTTSLPANGAVPIYSYVIGGNSNESFDLSFFPDAFSTGITVCNSSTIATKTIGAADCWFVARFV